MARRTRLLSAWRVILHTRQNLDDRLRLHPRLIPVSYNGSAPDRPADSTGPPLAYPLPPSPIQKGNDTLMVRIAMPLVSRKTWGLVSVFLCLAPLVAFAEPPQPASLTVHTPDEDSTWTRIDEEEKDGVAIFSRERPGNTIKEALAKGIVDAPPCRVFQVLRDTDRLVEFMPYLKARITKNTSADEEYVCEYLDLPWPIWDRFVSLRTYDVQNYGNNQCEYLLQWQKDDTYACTVEEAQQAYEDAVDDPIVPPVSEGYWHLVPQDGGHNTVVTYYGFTDPGGSIPHWVQNMFTQSAILKLFQAVRERANMSDLYPPCQCDQPAVTDSLSARKPDAGYLVDSSAWR